MAHEVVLGIDFGTSCTSAGALVGDRVELVQDSGDPVVPSVVYVPSRGPMEVGRAAQMRQLTDPNGVVRSVKRALGLKPDSDLLRRYAAGAPFRIETTGGRVLFKLGGTACAPEQLAAAILTRIRELAERRFGGRVGKAIIAMSAAAPDGYRDAIARAARIAHLDVVSMIPEPIAGALALGVHAESAERRLVVCDFGGGTFDVCAVIQSGMRFTPVATFGDPYLGGDDFDEAIAEGIAGHVVRSAGHDMHRDLVRWNELMFRSESVKRQLSSREEATLAMREAYVQGGRPRDLNILLDRPWVDACWRPLLVRAATVVDETIRRAGWAREDVDRVPLIGGTSQIPAFRAMLGQMFGDDKLLAADQADLAVAIGATLLTARVLPVQRTVPLPRLATDVDYDTAGQA